MLIVLSGGLGLIVGSFLNVLILRRGQKSLMGRSACVSCKAPIRWHDLVPVFSWLLLRGRCRDCGSTISAQYPLVEISTALLFILIAGAPITIFLKMLALPIAALLLAIAVHDLYTTIIPDPWVWSLNALAFFSVIVVPYAVLNTPLLLLAGPLAAFPLFALWLVSGGGWMGLGDAKLALSFGWLLGITSGLAAVFLAFVIGAVVSLALLLLSSSSWRNLVGRFTPTSISKKLIWGFTMKSEIPFGPFLIVSCFLFWLTQMYAVSLPLLFWAV